jgi:hypothetical protein
MAISKDEVSQSNTEEKKVRISNSPRPSGVAGTTISSRPSGVAGKDSPVTASLFENNPQSTYSGNAENKAIISRASSPSLEQSRDAGSLSDEMGYGRIVKIVMAMPK